MTLGRILEVSHFRVPGDFQQSKVAWLPGPDRGLIPPELPISSWGLLGSGGGLGVCQLLTLLAVGLVDGASTVIGCTRPRRAGTQSTIQGHSPLKLQLCMSKWCMALEVTFESLAEAVEQGHGSNM